MTPFEIFRSPLTLFRQNAGSYVNGIWIQIGETALAITASIQPTTGEEILSLPEARRNRKTYALFTSTKINLLLPLRNPDQIVIFGERYEIIRVEPWQNNPAVFSIINHYKFYASAIEAIL